MNCILANRDTRRGVCQMDRQHSNTTPSKIIASVFVSALELESLKVEGQAEPTSRFSYEPAHAVGGLETMKGRLSRPLGSHADEP